MTPTDFLTITQTVSESVCLLTTHGKILAANPTACKLFGMSLKQMQGKQLQEMICDTQHEKLRNVMRNWSASRQPVPATLNIYRGDGSSIEFYCHGNLLRPRSVDSPALIMLRSKEKIKQTGQFIALNNKISQLEREIRERRQVENALIDSEKQVRLLLDSAGEAVYGIDTQGHATFLNAACLRLLGFSDTGEMLGKNMHQLIHHSHADGSPYPYEESLVYQTCIGGEQMHRDDEVFFHRDGSSFPVEYTAYPVKQGGLIVGAVVTFQDISKRKEVEAELARSQETLERAQLIAHIGSWDWNFTTNTQHWSDEIYRIFGLHPQEFGATYEAFLEYIHPDDQELVVKAINKSVADEDIPYDIDHRVLRPNGEIRFVNERGKVYRDAKGNPIRLIGAIQDITEHKKSAEIIKRLNEELEQRVEKRTSELKTANDHLQISLQQLKETQTQLVQSEKMASLGGLVAGVAHEINTPLGVGVTAISHLETQLEKYYKIYGSNQLTRDDFESMLKSSIELSQIVQHNLLRAANLVRSFKQVAVDQTNGEIRKFNLLSYLVKITQSLQPKLKSGAHVVNISCPDNIELYSHPGAISQVITNLIMNSIIHGFEDLKNGVISITIDASDSEWINFKYHDDGIGMEPSTVKKVFEPFFTTRRSRGGTGLGMHIVFNLVNQTLGGTIECHSTRNEGATFFIRIPTNLFCQLPRRAQA